MPPVNASQNPVAIDRESATTIAWSEFVGPLHRFVAARVRVASDVDDLVQLILERALLKSGSVLEIDHVAGWLFAVARNAIADHHRSHARALLAAADALDALEDPLETTDEERSAVIACMEPLLQALPSDTAQLLRWADMESRPMQSIAHALGISLTAAKSRVQRARQDFVRTTRECCVMTIDARRRLTALTPIRSPFAKCTSCGSDVLASKGPAHEES
jgi:RNA polymerase sigma-70 factor, ECF subfamily